MITKIFRLTTLIGVLWLPAGLQAATLNVVGGELIGASGVVVNGTSYNVRFVDGTCQELFGGCDEPADFAFTRLAEAQIATQALLDQVFIDGPDGQFDSDPVLTAGCTFWQTCTAFVPYELQGVNFNVRLVGAINKAAGQGADSAGGTATLDFDQFVPGEANTFAVFTVVPVPAAVWLFGSALFGLGLLRRNP